MTIELMLYICSKAFNLAVMLGAPAVVSALAVTILISLFQAATQVNEQSLTFVPKIIATFVSILISGPWILYTIKLFFLEVYSRIIHMPLN